MDSLVIINRMPQEKALAFSNGLAAEGAIPFWKTCLRQVYFTHQQELNDLELLPTDKIYYSEEASKYLISILCGMESPVFGETEVFGQFKNFLQSQPSAKAYFNLHTKWTKFILETVKYIRSEFIHGLGSNSYGSTLRKLTKNYQHISIIGAGNLTNEVLPWLAKSKQVDVLVRNALDSKHQQMMSEFPQMKFESLSDVQTLSSVLILAAPIENEKVLQLIEKSGPNIEVIYDLRASGFEGLRSLENQMKLVSLSDFFTMVNNDKNRFAQIKKDLENYIKEKCIVFSNRSEVRPMGWEDLCL